MSTPTLPGTASPLEEAWPRPAQCALALLLALAALLIGYQAASMRWQHQPSLIENGEAAQGPSNGTPRPARDSLDSRVILASTPALPPRARQDRPKKGDDLLAPININTATADELQRLPGIGPTLAQRIIEARQIEPFRNVDDLRKVRGIGPKTLQRLRPLVTVGKKEV